MPGARRGAEEREGRVAGGERGRRGGEDGRAVTGIEKNMVKAMVDSGSIACTLSSAVVPRLKEAEVLSNGSLNPVDAGWVWGFEDQGACELVLTVWP